MIRTAPRAYRCERFATEIRQGSQYVRRNEHNGIHFMANKYHVECAQAHIEERVNAAKPHRTIREAPRPLGSGGMDLRAGSCGAGTGYVEGGGVMRLKALTGMHGAGKDTVADALPARKLAFADALYREVADAFGVTVEWLKDRCRKDVPQEALCLAYCTNGEFQGFAFRLHEVPSEDWELAADAACTPRSPRQILQWWGDYRRAQDPDYFTSRTRDAVEFAGYQGQPVVLTDCRFPNEAAMVRQLGGQIWQIVRPGHEPPRTGHASETTGDEFAPDVVIRNAGSLEELRAMALMEWEHVAR